MRMRYLFCFALFCFNGIAIAEKSVTLPVNNDPILPKSAPDPKRIIPEVKVVPFPVNDPITDALKVVEKYKNLYEKSDGRVGDVFVPYDKSIEYVKGLPNGTRETMNLKVVENAKEKTLQDKTQEQIDNEIIDEYFVMRHRLLAPTMRR